MVRQKVNDETEVSDEGNWMRETQPVCGCEHIGWYRVADDTESQHEEGQGKH